MLNSINSSHLIIPPPPPPPPVRTQSIRAVSCAESNDVFEPRPVAAATTPQQLEDAELIRRLRDENKRLLAMIEELRAELQVFRADNQTPTESRDSIEASRLAVLNEMSELEARLEAAHKTHAVLLQGSDDADAINLLISTMGPKANKLSAKMALQAKAKEFEANTIAPLNLRNAELFTGLTKITLKLTRITSALPSKNETVLTGLTTFLLESPNKLVAKQIKEAINTHPGQRAHDIKSILAAALMKFLETLRPDELSVKEWSHYLGSVSNPDCAAILLHYGIDSLERLTSAAEQHLTRIWKEEDRRIFVK